MTGILERLGVFLRAPDLRPRQEIEADIEEELATHIALRALDNEASGMAPDEARRNAELRFGDSRQVFAECLGIQMKERIMLQRINAVLVVLLVIGMGANLWVGARAQDGVRQDMADLRQNVASLASGLEGLVPPSGADLAAEQSGGSQVHVLGHVGKPGPISWRENLTLTRLISFAGDFGQFANRSKIQVLRNTPSGRITILVDFDEILEGRKPDLPLNVDDLVVVPESIF